MTHCPACRFGTNGLAQALPLYSQHDVLLPALFPPDPASAPCPSTASSFFDHKHHDLQSHSLTSSLYSIAASLLTASLSAARDLVSSLQAATTCSDSLGLSGCVKRVLLGAVPSWHEHAVCMGRTNAPGASLPLWRPKFGSQVIDIAGIGLGQQHVMCPTC